MLASTCNRFIFSGVEKLSRARPAGASSPAPHIPRRKLALTKRVVLAATNTKFTLRNSRSFSDVNVIMEPEQSHTPLIAAALTAFVVGAFGYFYNESSNRREEEEEEWRLPPEVGSIKMDELECQTRAQNGEPFTLHEVISIINGPVSEILIPYVRFIEISAEQYHDYRRASHFNKDLLNTKLSDKLSKLSHLKKVISSTLMLRFPTQITELTRSGAKYYNCNEILPNQCLYQNLKIFHIEVCRDPSGFAIRTTMPRSFLPMDTFESLKLNNVEFPKYDDFTTMNPSTFEMQALSDLTLISCEGIDHTLFYQHFPNLKSIEIHSFDISSSIVAKYSCRMPILERFTVGVIHLSSELIGPSSTSVERETMIQLQLASMLRNAPNLKYLRAYLMPVLSLATAALPATFEHLHVETISSQAAANLPPSMKQLYARFLVDENSFETYNGWYKRIQTPAGVPFHYTLQDLACYSKKSI